MGALRAAAPARRAAPTRRRPAAEPAVESDLDAIVEAIVYLYTESRRVTKEAAGRHGLTGPQLAVVKMLESVERLSLSELSSLIRARNSTVTGIIDRMEHGGLVARRRSDQDRRVVHIALTPAGRRLARTLDVEPVTIFRRVLSELEPGDAAALGRVLTKLARRVREIVRAPEPPLPPE
ncbi:MAG: MarR family transcriptional regulator [Polyangiaceae bacterium]|nr:MarR family transcriptional regulator [Polyangiaceae bacterium]